MKKLENEQNTIINLNTGEMLTDTITSGANVINESKNLNKYF